LADNPRKNSHPFDVRNIELLVALMSQHDLSEIDLREGDLRICLRRGTRVRGAREAAPAHPTPASAPAAPAEKKPEKPARKLHEIKSMAVGVFYAQEKPGAPPYVTKGSRVTPTTVVGQLAAMKLYTEITADCSGVIEEVLVKNEDPVEFDTVLFLVDTGA
jgi:acetyl-CoA carboxylase biotin carboxyl carrier protein